MTLDEQIKQFEDFVTKIENVKKFNTDEYYITANQQSIDDHENLISWLKELQLYRKGVAQVYHRVNILESSIKAILDKDKSPRGDGKSLSRLTTYLMMCGMHSAFDKCLEIMHEELDITEEDIK